MAVIRFRRNTAAGASSSNPVLAAGEPGVTIDGTTVVLKIGDGVTAWNSLPAYGTGGGGDPSAYIDTANTLDTAGKTIPGRDAVKAYIAAVTGGIGSLTAADIDTLAEINAILTDADLVSTSQLNAKSNVAIEVRSAPGSHTLDATDVSNFSSGKSMHLKGDGTGTLTIPLQSSVTFPAGFNLMFSGYTAVVKGSGTITVNPSSGSLTTSALAKSLLIRNGSDDWDLENGAVDTKLDRANTAVALTDGATIDLTATKHTLTTADSRTFTISYTGDDITIQLTLNTPGATFTFPTGSLCVSEGVASGNTTLTLLGVIGDRYAIAIKKFGSTYNVIAKNMNR